MVAVSGHPLASGSLEVRHRLAWQGRASLTAGNKLNRRASSINQPVCGLQEQQQKQSGTTVFTGSWQQANQHSTTSTGWLPRAASRGTVGSACQASLQNRQLDAPGSSYCRARGQVLVPFHFQSCRYGSWEESDGPKERDPDPVLAPGLVWPVPGVCGHLGSDQWTDDVSLCFKHKFLKNQI